MAGPAVSVIVVTWNAGDVLGDCLDSLARQRVEGGLETIVVDGGSTDATGELLSRRDGIVVLAKEENVGYSAGNNEAAALARGDVLVFLNPDTVVVDAGAVDTLARIAREPGTGLVGPRLENPDGSLQPSCAGHLGLLRVLLVMSGLHRLLPPALCARALPERWSHDVARDTGWLKGAALAIRADVFAQAGGFWSTMYAEEKDLAYRLQRRGLRVRYEPSVRVMHVGNHSVAKRWSDAERAARVAQAELAFLRTHYGRPRVAAIRALLAVGHGLRSLVHGLFGRRERAGVYRAMAHAYARRVPPTAT